MLQAVRLRIVAVGKMREPYAQQACAEFCKRLQRFLRVEILEIRASSRRDPRAALEEEGERIVHAVGPQDCVWLLDGGGTQLDSIELSREFARLEDGSAIWTVVIGGAFGCSNRVHERADFAWSLSRLTFLHEWARAIVLEQLYRAAKIARNEPYHH